MFADFSILRSLLIEDENKLSNQILRQLCKETHADLVNIFFLSPTTGAFEIFDSYGDHKLNRNYNIIYNSDSCDIPNTQKECIICDHQLVFKIFRNKICLGFLEIYKEGLRHSSDKIQETLDNIAFLFLIVHERLFIKRMLATTQEPIYFEAIGHDDFFLKVMDTIKVASGIQLIALREYIKEEDELRCLGLSGFGNVSLDDFTFKGLDIPIEFLSVLIDKTTNFVQDAEHIEWVRSNKLLNKVRSFIAIPIRVGRSIFGVLSFGTTVMYPFSGIEILSLESIANGIGIAIANYRNYNLAKEDIVKYSETAVTLTGLEIAQAARHEAKNILNNLQLKITSIKEDKTTKITDKDTQLNWLSTNIKNTVSCLEKIKTATKPPEKVIEKLSLKCIWDQAVSALSGKFVSLNINVRYSGQEPIIEMYPEWLRHVFLNLLLNSVDAFSRGSKNKRGRTVNLVVDKYVDNFSKVMMTYSDNAGGVETHNLAIPESSIKYRDDLNQLLFEPNVTSKGKEEGSGWGLYLVRKIVQDHSGSIDLVRYRQGVSFQIELLREIPKR